MNFFIANMEIKSENCLDLFRPLIEEPMKSEDENNTNLVLPDTSMDDTVDITMSNEPKKRLVADYCSHSCGAFGDCTLLRQHELICPLKFGNITCLIDQCEWKGPKHELVIHVCANHYRDLIVVYPSRQKFIRLKFISSYKLLVLFPKSYPYNELYWIRQYEQDNETYFMVQHFGQIGHRMPIEKAKEYVIKIGNVSYTHDIEECSIDEQMSIKNNLFMIASGLKIGKCMEESVYLLSIPKFLGSGINEGILEVLKCNKCKVFRRPPFGGSIRYCQSCNNSMINPSLISFDGLRDKNTPLFGQMQFKQSDPQTSFSFTNKSEEDWVAVFNKLSRNVEYGCLYASKGCMEYVLQVNNHERLCPFRSARCWICSADIGSKQLINHANTVCSSKTIKNDSTIKFTADDILIGKSIKYLLADFGHLFNINIETCVNSKTVANISITQVLQPLYNDFWASVEAKVDGVRILNMSMLCQQNGGVGYFSNVFKNIELNIKVFKPLE